MFWLNGHVSPEGRLLGVAVKNGEEAFHEELHLILRPHDPVGMEGRVGCLSAWDGVPRANSAPSRLRRVDCGVVPRGTCSVVYLFRPVLHDVGFAAGGPSRARDVAAQGPERRPQALVCRIGELDAGFKNAVLEVLFAFGIHAPGYPGSVDVSGLDHQVPAPIDAHRGGRGTERRRALRRVVRITGRSAVHFDFSVAPPVIVPQVEVPHRRVRRTGAAVEFLTPLRRVSGSIADPAAAAGCECHVVDIPAATILVQRQHLLACRQRHCACHVDLPSPCRRYGPLRFVPDEFGFQTDQRSGPGFLGWAKLAL